MSGRYACGCEADDIGQITDACDMHLNVEQLRSRIEAKTIAEVVAWLRANPGDHHTAPGVLASANSIERGDWRAK